MKNSRALSYRACLAVLSCLTAGNAIAQSVTDEHPGAALFQQNYSSCHVEADSASPLQTAPTLESLQALTAASLEFAINEGVMYGQASVLSNQQKALIVDYLAVEEDDSWLADTMCEVEDRVVDLNQTVYLARPGVDISRTRKVLALDLGSRPGVTAA